MTLISCIVVSYNNASYLRKAISSVLMQLMPIDEIVIADDFSTDGSRELIESLAREYQCIRPILRQRNVGVAANRDLAIREANGKLITTLDGDDWFLPCKVEAEYKRLQSSAKADVLAYSNVCTAHNNEEILACPDMSGFARLSRRERVGWLASRLGPIPRDMLMPKSLYLEVGGFHHSLKRYEDWDLKIRLAARSGEWLHSGVNGIVYRRTGQGLSSVGTVGHLGSQYRVIAKNKSLLFETIGYGGVLRALVRPFLSWF